jgi:hypothetical protein
MGCGASFPIADYPSFAAFQRDLTTYVPADGIEVVWFIDRTASNNLCTGGTLTGRMLDGCPEVTGTVKSQCLHRVPRHLEEFLRAVDYYLTMPNAILSAPELNDYVKAMLLSYLGLLAACKSVTVSLFTFGGRTENGCVTQWSRHSTIREAIAGYYRAVVKPSQYGHVTDFKPCVVATVALSREYKQPVLGLIFTDGMVSPQCAVPSSEAFQHASRYPVCFSIVGIGNAQMEFAQLEDDNVHRKRFDNVQSVRFKEIVRAPATWSEDPSYYMQLRVLMEVPRQLRAIEHHRLGWQHASESKLRLPEFPNWDDVMLEIVPSAPSVPSAPKAPSVPSPPLGPSALPSAPSVPSALPSTLHSALPLAPPPPLQFGPTGATLEALMQRC